MHDPAAARCARVRRRISLALVTLAFNDISPAWAAAAEGPAVFGIPVDFILFGVTLLGVGIFHHHTLTVALTGLTVVIAYKLGFTGFNTGPGIGGLGAHFVHEWVILTNLLGLLLGFALLSNHFERSHVPAALPRFLPNDWKGGVALLALIFVLSAFLDNIAAALIGATIAGAVYRRKVHIGYLAAIVAVSNAGGAGSVVGDTTTTMMWIDGVSAIDVLPAFIAAFAALIVIAIPAALLQQRHSPIVKDASARVHVDWARVWIVVIILLAAVATNVTINSMAPIFSRFGSLTAGEVPVRRVWAMSCGWSPVRSNDGRARGRGRATRVRPGGPGRLMFQSCASF